MSQLTVRRLLVDLQTPFERHWNGGDPFRSAFFNALSLSFPFGEQFFIDSVRNAAKTLPPAKQEKVAAPIAGFIGQEATHRRIHALYNEHLLRQGYVNAWEARVIERTKRLEGMDPRHPLAITAANEHFTAIFAEHLLTHRQALAGADPRLQTMWLWHASEESEHRSIAFDVYRATGGSEAWRLRWMRMTTLFFLSDLMRQVCRNLAHDRQLWRWRTWTSAWTFLFGKSYGLIRHTFGPWRLYFKADFHPSQYGGVSGERWLAENQASFVPVRAADSVAASA
jgi:uncharacterized protein